MSPTSYRTAPPRVMRRSARGEVVILPHNRTPPGGRIIGNSVHTTGARLCFAARVGVGWTPYGFAPTTGVTRHRHGDDRLGRSHGPVCRGEGDARRALPREPRHHLTPRNGRGDFRLFDRARRFLVENLAPHPAGHLRSAHVHRERGP